MVAGMQPSGALALPWGGVGLGSVAVAQNAADFAALACMRFFAAVFFSAAV